MSVHEYVFNDPAQPPLQINQDPVGVGSASGHGDPSWCWRLWDGAVVLSKYLETTLANDIKGATVLELGSGTGLVALVAARLGARQVIATDLMEALALFIANARLNMGFEGERRDTEGCCPRCPNRHELTTCATDCEDYICNVCDAEIDCDVKIYQCRDCDFDLCKSCFNQASMQEWQGLPSWFQISCNSGADSHASWHPSNPEENGHVLACPLDWSNPDGVIALMETVESQTSPMKKQPISFILAADVTFSLKSIELFLNQLERLREDLPDTGAAALQALVLHDPRGEELDAAIFQGLEAKAMPCERIDIGHLDGNRAGDMVLLRIMLRPSA